MPPRKFLQYELNWLKKYGFDLNSLVEIGEKPVEYVTGHAQFQDLIFKVSPDTLIPRIETEEIIPLATDSLSSLPPKHLNIADIGTGSGCIGITLTDKLKKVGVTDFDIYLSDISHNALAIANQNANNILGPDTSNLHILHSSLLEKYPYGEKFDLIIANLPYIPSKRIHTLDSSVRDYEPVSALDGGIDGTEIINTLLDSISPFLEQKFLVILEIDSSQKLDLFAIPSHTNAILKQDSFSKPRFLLLTPKQ